MLRDVNELNLKNDKITRQQILKEIKASIEVDQNCCLLNTIHIFRESIINLTSFYWGQNKSAHFK